MIHENVKYLFIVDDWDFRFCFGIWGFYIFLPNSLNLSTTINFINKNFMQKFSEFKRNCGQDKILELG